MLRACVAPLLKCQDQIWSLVHFISTGIQVQYGDLGWCLDAVRSDLGCVFSRIVSQSNLKASCNTRELLGRIVCFALTCGHVIKCYGLYSPHKLSVGLDVGANAHAGISSYRLD